MSAARPTCYDDTIDSRDVIAAIEHLAQLREPGPVDLGSEDNAAAQEDLFDELRALEALAEQGERSFDDWRYGATLIRDSYFQEYAQDLAHDIGSVPDGVAWPMTCIDWEQAARELRMDYTPITFGGVTYWTSSST